MFEDGDPEARQVQGAAFCFVEDEATLRDHLADKGFQTNMWWIRLGMAT